MCVTRGCSTVCGWVGGVCDTPGGSGLDPRAGGEAPSPGVQGGAPWGGVGGKRMRVGCRWWVAAKCLVLFSTSRKIRPLKYCKIDPQKCREKRRKGGHFGHFGATIFRRQGRAKTPHFCVQCFKPISRIQLIPGLKWKILVLLKKFFRKSSIFGNCNLITFFGKSLNFTKSN